MKNQHLKSMTKSDLTYNNNYNFYIYMMIAQNLIKSLLNQSIPF